MSSEEKCMELVSKANCVNVDVDKKVMQQSLSSITHEIQRFHFCNSSCPPQNNLFEIVKKCKASLNCKKRKIKKLSENIKTLCIIARAVISAKERQSNTMKTLVETIEKESANIIQDNIRFQKIIYELANENKNVYNKIANIHNWINQGYEKIQNIRNEPIETFNLLTKLKMIILYCGQYYSDFLIENHKCKQLEQKTRFYYHKLKIVENHLKSVTDELKNIRYQNMKLLGQKYYEKGFISNFPIVCSERPTTSTIKRITQKKLLIVSQSNTVSEQFDLTSHLRLVRKLLADQNTMIQNLNQLSREINSFE